MNTQNPLSSYFRSPKLYTKLPSQGKFYTEDIISWPDTNELPVFAMTAKDEMIMKNPDALLNGEAVAQVISSCVPCVRKPKNLVSNDVDALLVAIQGATYGDNVDVDATCPNCTEEVSGVASIEAALDMMSVLEKSYSFDTSQNLHIEIRPFSYSSTVKAGIANFKSTRSLQNIANITDEIEQLSAFNKNFIQIASMNFDLIVDSVASISGKLPNGEDFVVTDQNNIREFLENCESSIGKNIENMIEEVNGIGVNKIVMLQCESCGHQFEQNIGFNPVNFSTAS